MSRTAYHTPDPRRGRLALIAMAAVLLAGIVAVLAYRPVPPEPRVDAGSLRVGDDAIALPWRAIAAQMYGDGGTITVAIVDADGVCHFLTLELDGSVRVGDPGAGKGGPVDRAAGLAAAHWALAAGRVDPRNGPSLRSACATQLDFAFPRNWERLLRRLGISDARPGLTR